MASDLAKYAAKVGGKQGRATIRNGRVVRPKQKKPAKRAPSNLSRYAGGLNIAPVSTADFAYQRGDPEISSLVPRKTQMPGGGSWFQNLGKDAMSMVQGLPGTLKLVGRIAATPTAATHGYTLGLIPGVPGGGSARSFTSGTGKELVKAGQATVEDFKYRYGPAFRGDWGTFGSRVKEHPGFFALDAASVASLGAGSAVKGAQIGVKAGRALERGRIPVPKIPGNMPPPTPASATLQHLTGARRASKAPVKAAGRLENKLTSPKLVKLAESKQLKNRIRTRKITTTAETVGHGDDIFKLDIGAESVRKRNAPASPLARYVSDKFDSGVLGTLESLSNKSKARRTGKDRYMSTAARDRRAIGREGKRAARSVEGKITQSLHEKTRDFSREVLYRRGVSKNKNVEALVTLRADGIAVPKGGTRASVRVGEMVKRWEEELARDRKNGMSEEALAGQQANIDLVKNLPVEMIDNPTPLVVRATEETLKVKRATQSIREQMAGKHGIRGKTKAFAGAYREAMASGAKHSDEYGGIIHPQKLEALKARGYTHVSEGALTAAARDIYKGKYKRGQSSPSQAHQAVLRMIQEGSLPAVKSHEGRLLKLDVGNPYKQVVAAYRGAHEGRVPLTNAGKIDTAALAEKYKFDTTLREQMDNPEIMFAHGDRPSFDAGHRSSLNVGYAGTHQRGSNAVSGFGATGNASRRTTGHSYMGRDSLSRESTMASIQKAVSSFYTKESVRDTIDRFALRAHGSDKPFVISSQEMMRQLDGDKWTVVSTRGLEDMLTEINIENPGMRTLTHDMFDSEARLQKAWKDGNDAVVAIPRVLADEMKTAMREPSKLVQKYDSTLSMWRAGILAYTPRWFMNNLVGTSIFLGVMGGIDMRAFRQASRDSKFYEKNLIPHEVESVSHSAAAGRGGSDIGRGGLQPQYKTKFMRGAHTMFKLNERLEGRLRRAGYMTRATQNLRTEGLLRGRNLRKRLTDDELFDAMLKMPDELKAQTIKDLDFFIGQYKSFSNVEKNVLRRVIPFYSWIRVVNTWAFGLPFKSPIRAEAVRIATTMGNALEVDKEGLPLWEKGRLEFGPFALRTNNINPLYSVAEEISAVAGSDPVGGAGITDLLRVGGGASSPLLQILSGQLSGRSTFGNRDFAVPTGYRDSVSQFGRGRQKLNPVTGEIEDFKPSPNIFEQAFDQLLPYAGPIRQGLAGSRQPYDTTSTLDLLAGRAGLRDIEKLLQPPAKNSRGRGKLPYGLGALSGVAGVPIYTVDKQQERLQIEKAHQEYLRAILETKRQKAKEQLRRLAR